MFFLDKEYSLILFMTYFVESEMFNSSFCATTCSVPNFPEILIVYGFYLSFYIKLVDIKSIVRDVTRTLIGGGGCIFIYSCSARRVSFQIKFKFLNLK